MELLNLCYTLTAFTVKNTFFLRTKYNVYYLKKAKIRIRSGACINYNPGLN